MKKLILFAAAFLLFVNSRAETFAPGPAADNEPLIRNTRLDGYLGIWYFNEKLDNEYVYKYSGGLGTYCAKHQPFAVFAPAVNKTFFCYGGRYKGRNSLVHAVSYFDHYTGQVPRPTLLLDKGTTDAHDNPVISLDREGYIWIFSSSHGTGRPSYVSRSRKPYDIDEFELKVTTNFSYPQPWFSGGKGFFFFHTRYNFIEGCDRTLCFITSPDGISWSEPKAVAAMERGHYQVSGIIGNKVGTAFNVHPRPEGLNWRTDLYYLESTDFGRTWQTVDGRPVEIPLRNRGDDALVYDAGGLNVYLKDINFDASGNPVILVLTSRGYASGPDNGPRTWTILHWNGKKWRASEAFLSDNNYDMGSLYLEGGTWVIVAPSGTGPQLYNPGGEVQMWESRDQGINWNKVRDMTSDSPRNHTFIRRPVGAHPDFYAFWADGHGRMPSESRLYFANRKGEVFQLPVRMDADFEKPSRVLPDVSRRTIP